MWPSQRCAEQSSTALQLIPRLAQHGLSHHLTATKEDGRPLTLTTALFACSVPASKSTWSTDGSLLALVTEGVVSVLDGKSLQQVCGPVDSHRFPCPTWRWCTKILNLVDMAKPHRVMQCPNGRLSHKLMCPMPRLPEGTMTLVFLRHTCGLCSQKE